MPAEVDHRAPTRTLAQERAATALAMAVAILAQLVIPQRLVLGPAYLVPAIEATLLGVLLLGRWRTSDPHHVGLRRVALALAAMLVAANVFAVGRLIRLVLTGIGGGTAADLVRAGAGIWITNVIAFAVLYWEIDLGGPAARILPGPDTSLDDDVPDFLFPQYDSSRTPDGWLPTFADYLYTSFANATAFSPTDTMPTGHRAKAMMAMQSAVALLTIAFLFARAVNMVH